MVECILIAGQSNASAYSPLINTKDRSLVSPYVPSYARTAANEWTGAAPASLDTGIQYPYPTAALNPCLYNENTRGDATGIFDNWGAFDKQFPQYNSAGALGVGGQYGLELSFLANYRAASPASTLACIKQSLGGTSLRGDWLPPTVSMGAFQSVGSGTATLSAGDPSTSNQYTGQLLQVLSGTGTGSTTTITAYNAGTKVVTYGAWTGTAPTAGSTYGVEKLQTQLLRTMYTQGAARLTTSYGAQGTGWRVACLVWMQGESGAHSASTAADDSQYLSDARAFFAYVRSLTSTPTLPVVIGRIGDNWLNSNVYQVAAGYPYAAIDYSATGLDPRTNHGTTQQRLDFQAGALARRATQATLGHDAHCVLWDNDGYPSRPPFWQAWATFNGQNIDTSNVNEVYGYHWAGPGNLTAGERAFRAYQNLVSPQRLRMHIGNGGKLRLRGAV